jgi:glutaredoxin
MNKLLIILLLLLVLAGCTKTDEISVNYPLINDKDHVFEYTDAKTVIDMLESETATEVVVFVFTACPWCQQSLPRLNVVAKEEGIKKIYLLDIKEMRTNKTPEYMTIFEKVKDHVDFTEGSLEKQNINVPNIIVIKNGQIIGSHMATVTSHVKDENSVLPPMTAEQETEYKNIVRNLLEQIK